MGDDSAGRGWALSTIRGEDGRRGSDWLSGYVVK